MRFRWASDAIFTEPGRTPAGHPWRLLLKTASVAARWNFNFAVKFQRALTELPHRSPIVTTSENTPAGARPSIGRCPVHLRQPEDEVFNGHRTSSDRAPADVGLSPFTSPSSASDEESSVAPKQSTELYQCRTSAGLCDWAIRLACQNLLLVSCYVWCWFYEWIRLMWC